VLLCLSIILGGFVAYMRFSVTNYYNASEVAFDIPDIDNGYIPQGIHYQENKQVYLLSGYNNSNAPSPIYLLNDKGELLKKVTLLDENGKDYFGHCGGVAVFNKYLYVAGNYGILVYSFDKLFSAENGDKLELLGKINLKYSDTDYIRTSFITVNNDTLITGEFYRAGNSSIPDSHKFTTKGGDYNQAIAVEFDLSTSYTDNFGVAKKPQKAYSMPDLVQGFAVYGNKIYLSCSYGLAFSNIFEYEKDLLNKRNETSTFLGTQLSVYELDNLNLTYTYKIAPMSEELVFVNDMLIVNCESASNKYIFGKFTDSRHLYATNINKMK
jgi:hypothetical protein